MRFELLQQYIGRDLEQYVRDKEDGQGVVVLMVLQFQVRLKPKYTRIGDVGTIEKGEEVEQTQDGDDAEIDTCDELSRGRVRGTCQNL